MTCSCSAAVTLDDHFMPALRVWHCITMYAYMAATTENTYMAIAACRASCNLGVCDLSPLLASRNVTVRD